MSVKIRLKRMGRRKRPFYRIVAIDSKTRRDGREIERLGWFDPLNLDVAINLKPQSDDNSFNLLQLLKKNYNHFDMGIYLSALDDGEINIENTIEL